MKRNLENFKIYLIDINGEMCDAWSKTILKYEDELYDLPIEIYEGSFYSFATRYNPYIDAWVSPANSYGLMDRGYDGALIDYYGKSIQDKIQQKIKDEYFCEQPVGTSISVFFPEGYLIHTPTMRIPSIIKDYDVVYHCTRSCLIEALRLECNSILIPAFGAGTGKVPYDIVAENMIKAIIQLKAINQDTSWKYARWQHPLSKDNHNSKVEE